MHFPELLFIRILHDNASVFCPRSWIDLIYVSIMHNPSLTCLNAPIDFVCFL
ncbi:unnamed protein product [Hymenolepis diminuta]|uniref:Uncharacterized protein n=1 Tax=Hymenolepis diminuta TaxID=6216 RepID=A0A564ZDB2_HYMDI|nr:unnamed protein product [Hymenolepis diminuta]